MSVATITVDIAMVVQYASVAATFNLHIIFKFFVKLKSGCAGTPMGKWGNGVPPPIYRCL